MMVIWYGKGHGMLITFDNKVGKYTLAEFGKVDDDGKLRNLGSVTFDTNDTGFSIICIEKYNWSFSR